MTGPVPGGTRGEALAHGPRGWWSGAAFGVGVGLLATAAGFSDMPVVGMFFAVPLMVPALLCLALGLRVPGIGCFVSGLTLTYVVYVGVWTGVAANQVLLSVKREVPYVVPYVLLWHWVLAPSAVVLVVKLSDSARPLGRLAYQWLALFAIFPGAVLVVRAFGPFST